MKWRCSFCEEPCGCSCPDDEPHVSYLKQAVEESNAKTLCRICSELLEQGVKEEDLKTTPLRREVKKGVKIEETAEIMATAFSSKIFTEIWAEDKGFLKSLSKKELAEEMHYHGAFQAIISFLQNLDEEELNRFANEVRDASKLNNLK